MNKKILFIILSLIFFCTAPAAFAETVNTSEQTIADMPAQTAEEYYQRANIYKKQGNFTQAIADYTKVISINSKHAKAYYNRGNIYAKQDNLSQAITDYTRAIEINPQYKDAYYNRGNAYGKLGKLTQAITDYTSAIEIDSKYAAAYCNRGNAYQTQGNFHQAIADYDKAIEINPDIAGFYSNRGKAYQTQDKLHQAIADYNKSIELNPNDNATYYNRGLANYAAEQYKNSLADYKKATSNHPDKEAYDDFIKYAPVKKATDTENVWNEILQLFSEKLTIDKKTAMPATEKAPITVAKPSAELAAAPDIAAPEAPVATSAVTNENLAQANRKNNDMKSIPKEDIRNLVNQWATSWQAGDMKAYRSCYASDFQSKGVNLDAWISHKAALRRYSKNIKIRIDHLQISADANIATAVFTQHYSSSTLKNKSRKKLELRKINNEWKIYRETILP